MLAMCCFTSESHTLPGMKHPNIVAPTIAGCFMTDKCDDTDTQAIKETMNGLATKAFALYAAEKAGQVANEKKNICPKCGEE